MDTNDGFFPEREVLRARRLRAMIEKPVDPSVVEAEARKRRNTTWAFWFAMSIGMGLPMYVAITSSWHGYMPSGLRAAVLYVLYFVLAGCVACVAVVLWRNLRRANNRGS